MIFSMKICAYLQVNMSEKFNTKYTRSNWRRIYKYSMQRTQNKKKSKQNNNDDV